MGEKSSILSSTVWSRTSGLAVISHCEDLSLSSDGVMHEGTVCSRLGLKGIPAAGEEVMVRREISPARKMGLPVHIARVSTAGSEEAIGRAKEAGVPVSAETAPHYFSLDHRALEEYNTPAEMNPPPREPGDVEAIKKGLSSHTLAEKNVASLSPFDSSEKGR